MFTVTIIVFIVPVYVGLFLWVCGFLHLFLGGVLKGSYDIKNTILCIWYALFLCSLR